MHRALRRIYCDIAEVTTGSRVPSSREDEWCDGISAGERYVRAAEEVISEVLPLVWRQLLPMDHLAYPASFVVEVMEFVQSQDELSSNAFDFTWP